MVNSISTAALYNAYSTDLGAKKALSSTTTVEGLKKQEAAPVQSPTTIVNLSNEA